MPQLLSLRSRAREPQLLSLCTTTTETHVPRARAKQREATAMRSLRSAMKRSPRSPRLEKARTQQRRPNAAKNKQKFKIKVFFKKRNVEVTLSQSISN